MLEEFYSLFFCSLPLGEEQMHHSVHWRMDYNLYICRAGELGFRAEGDVTELKTDEYQDEEFGEDGCREYFQGLCSPMSLFGRDEMR